jgi:hypothetical protein
VPADGYSVGVVDGGLPGGEGGEGFTGKAAIGYDHGSPLASLVALLESVYENAVRSGRSHSEYQC